MESTATYRITAESGVVIADGLPRSAPAIQLHEGRARDRNGRRPKDLAPGESTFVVYPLDAAKGGPRPEIRCAVTRTDAAGGNESAPTSADNEAAPSFATIEAGEPALPEPRRGGRRSRKATPS
jgi:hypothetical protein